MAFQIESKNKYRKCQKCGIQRNMEIASKDCPVCITKKGRAISKEKYVKKGFNYDALKNRPNKYDRK